MATKMNRCVIVAGSPEADAAFIRQTVRRGDFVICADRGFAAAKAAGITPDLVIGDFDSYEGEPPQGCEIVRLIPEKDDTDTAHCVNTALDRGFCEIVLLAALGGRLDHSLANLCLLELIADRGGRGIILSRNETVQLLRQGRHVFSGCEGKTFSVLPFGCPQVSLTYEGAYYPLRNGTLTHAFPMGVSNIFTADQAAVTVHSGQALMIMNE